MTVGRVSCVYWYPRGGRASASDGAIGRSLRLAQLPAAWCSGILKLGVRMQLLQDGMRLVFGFTRPRREMSQSIGLRCVVLHPLLLFVVLVLP